MWLHTDQIAAHAKAGQFVSVYCNDGSRLLPRPISICEIDKKDGAIRLVYRVAGKGTAEFSGMHTGAQLRIVGPLGNGFPKKEKKAFLIGGGIGIPPMLQLAKELNCEKQIVLGFRDELFLMDEFKSRAKFTWQPRMEAQELREMFWMRSVKWTGRRDYLCLRTNANASCLKDMQRKSHRVLDLHGGAYGMRYWCVPCLCMSVKEKTHTAT